MAVAIKTIKNVPVIGGDSPDFTQIIYRTAIQLPKIGQERIAIHYYVELDPDEYAIVTQPDPTPEGEIWCFKNFTVSATADVLLYAEVRWILRDESEITVYPKLGYQSVDILLPDSVPADEGERAGLLAANLGDVSVGIYFAMFGFKEEKGSQL